MPTLTRFWHAIEDMPTLAAVDAEWRNRLGDEYRSVKRFLRRGSGRASTYPRTDGGMPYAVVVHGRDDVVGICPETGERVLLTDDDIVVSELDLANLARALSLAFQVKSPGRIEKVGPR